MPSADYVSQSGQFYSGSIDQNGSAQGNPFSGVGMGIANALTGDLDYARQLESMGFQNAFNAQQAQIQRDYEERLANTSYQRAVKDLRAAGLNPYLAYSQGGASTPSGYAASSATGVASKSGSIYGAILSALVGALGGIAGKAISSATSIATAKTRADSALDVAKVKAKAMEEVANTARESHIYHYNGRSRR